VNILLSKTYIEGCNCGCYIGKKPKNGTDYSAIQAYRKHDVLLPDEKEQNVFFIILLSKAHIFAIVSYLYQ
jgi:hypothetical protein